MTRPIIHIAGPVITFDNVRRQRCVWCGALIDEWDLANIARPLEPGEDPDNPDPWEPGRWEGWVAISGTNPVIRDAVPEPADEKAPERSCMQLLPADG